MLKSIVRMAVVLMAMPAAGMAQGSDNAGEAEALVWCSQDSITPQSISHNVDAIYRGEQAEQIYNFIDYHFEQADQYIRARTYVDEIDAVVIYGPFASAETLEPVENDAFKDAVLSYLKRRFLKIEELGGENFQVVWEWSASQAPSLELCEPVLTADDIP